MINLSQVNKIYRGKATSFQALYDISLRVADGEMLAVMGRSGCGKTTLLNILGLMDRMDSGEYTLAGRSVHALSRAEAALTRNRQIGFVYQTFNLISDYTARENVEMPMGYAGIAGKERRERAAELLAQVGLKDKQRNRPGELSGGERQRVAIARALANRPGLILADEPTGNLDRKNGEDIMALLSDLNHSGVTLVLVTHDETVARNASRIIYMEDGRIS